MANGRNSLEGGDVIAVLHCHLSGREVGQGQTAENKNKKEGLHGHIIAQLFSPFVANRRKRADPHTTASNDGERSGEIRLGLKDSQCQGSRLFRIVGSDSKQYDPAIRR